MLDDVHLSGSALVAESSNAVAVSEIIYQEAEDTDFESVREARARWLLGNICDGIQSSADKAVIIGDVQEGDRIFVVDSSNVPIETVATGIATEYNMGLVPVMTSTTEPSGKITADYYGSSYTGPFDNDINSYLSVYSYLTYEFPEPVEAKYFHLHAYYGAYASINYNIYVYGSNDGTNYVRLFGKTIDLGGSSSNNRRTWEIYSPGKFKYYKITGFNNYVRIYTLQYYTEPGKTIDTSAVTNGATPKYVYRFEDKIKFNSTYCAEKSIYKEFGTHGSQLYIQNIYNDVTISGRTLQTTVEFSAPGNSALEITGQVYKQP